MGFLKGASEFIGAVVSAPIALGGGAVSYVYHRIDGKDHDAAADTSGNVIGSIIDGGVELAGEVGPPVLNTLIGLGVTALIGKHTQNNNNHKPLS